MPHSAWTVCTWTLPLLLWSSVALGGTDSSLVTPGAKVRKLAGGFIFTEGPAVDAAGNVFFSDVRGEKTYCWSLVPRLKLTGQVLPISYVQARKAPESPKEPGGANCAKEHGRGLPARVFRRGCDGVRLTRQCRSLRLARTGEDSEPPARSRTRER